MRRVLDTNIVLYHLGGKLAIPLPAAEYSISVITELELLSYPNLDLESENKIRAFIRDVTVLPLDTAIRDATIDLRRRYRLRLPDAIIAGTALATNAELITNDANLLKVKEVSSISAELAL